ncbi:hypothetical protein GALL_496690 [mine drainage metagenome]|uniref:Uncharacterized protein n=1 Tax=mine drainage metagenome TaxID=410659 RepID=A0A1J5PTX1_9ZZZZ
MSLAWVRPTIRGSTQDSPNSAGKLNRPWAAVNLAPAAANLRSAKAASTRPTPAAGPLIAAMIGLPQPIIAFTRSPVMRVKASSPFISRPTSGPMISCTSPPEQKLPPFEAKTTTSTSSA